MVGEAQYGYGTDIESPQHPKFVSSPHCNSACERPKHIVVYLIVKRNTRVVVFEPSRIKLKVRTLPCVAVKVQMQAATTRIIKIRLTK